MKTVENLNEKSLDEVRKDLGPILNDDSILAGHSAKNDTKHLQIYHPYIIDGCIIYNVTGTRLEKSSFQRLRVIFFG